jgi:Ca2+-binding EF-hand superfamily protein
MPKKIQKELTEEELSELQEIFDLADTDHGGSISQDELGSLLRTLGLQCNDDQLERMFKEADADGGGAIEFNEFVSVCSKAIEANYSSSLLTKAFRNLESSEFGEGRVSTEILEGVLRRYDVEPEKIMEVITTIDPENNCYVNYMSYINLLNADIMQDVALFNVEGMSSQFTSSLTSRLRSRTYKPNEIIIRKGELGKDMFFISTGYVEVISEDTPPKVIASLREGDCFGEIAVLFDQRRSATVRACTFCDILALSKTDIAEVSTKFPNDLKLLKNEASKRRQSISTTR